jgi:hypothetical protein
VRLRLDVEEHAVWLAQDRLSGCAVLDQQREVVDLHGGGDGIDVAHREHGAVGPRGGRKRRQAERDRERGDPAATSESVHPAYPPRPK